MTVLETVADFPAFLARKRGNPPKLIEGVSHEVKMLPDLEDLARAVERTREELSAARTAHDNAVLAFGEEMKRRGLTCQKP